eukprot:7385963-Prymnesium_polylepis.1
MPEGEAGVLAAVAALAYRMNSGVNSGVTEVWRNKWRGMHNKKGLMAPDPGRVACAKSDRVAVAMA